jgi:hypothetical protein
MVSGLALASLARRARLCLCWMALLLCCVDDRCSWWLSGRDGWMGMDGWRIATARAADGSAPDGPCAAPCSLADAYRWSCRCLKITAGVAQLVREEEEEAGCGEAARPMRVWSCMWRARRHTDAGAARGEAKRCAPETTRRIAWLVSREAKVSVRDSNLLPCDENVVP